MPNKWVDINLKKFKLGLVKLWKKNRMSQKQLCKEMWIPEATILKIKQNWRASFKTISKLEEYMDIDIK